MDHRGVSDSSPYRDAVSGVQSSIVGVGKILPTNIIVVHCCCGSLGAVEDSRNKDLTYDGVVVGCYTMITPVRVGRS